MSNIPSAIDQTVTPLDPKEMTPFEIDQFLTCARVGRIGIVLKGESYPYVVPVGYGYFEGRIFFHTCREGLKMKAVQSNPDVCFEVDESISDGSLAKSVIIFGRMEVIKEKDKMIPYLQKLIDKYRVPVSFNEYMAKGNRNIEDELENVRICLIAPKKITGKKMVRTNSNL
jgi:nitroimidazol reductase NimA-like FMN-containing flavoprotein (pyridoxamine 5'-phosphate oxidase superfamily)